jgi:hypothetical protein
MSRSKKNIKHKNKRVKSKKNMRGGFAPDEMQHLLDNGFQQDQIDELSALNVSIDTINQAIEYFNNNFNAHQIIFEIAKNLHNNLPPLNNIGLQGNTNQEQPAPAPPAENNDTSQNSEQGPLLNLSDLQVPEGQEVNQDIEAIPPDANDNHNLDMNQSLDLSGDTSLADESMNTSINSSNASTDSSNTSTDGSIASMNAGKRIRRYSKKRVSNLRRKKSHRRLKGGATYGTGYGANCTDPNFSIYNTNLTKLFPYRPSIN